MNRELSLSNQYKKARAADGSGLKKSVENARRWMRASAMRTTAHASRSDASLTRSNSDGTCILNFMRDPKLVDPNTKTKSLLSSRSTATCSDDAKAFSAGRSAGVEGAAYSELREHRRRKSTPMTDDELLSQPPPEMEEAHYLQVPSADQSRSAITLAFLQACNPEVLCLAQSRMADDDEEHADQLAAASVEISPRAARGGHAGANGKSGFAPTQGNDYVKFTDYRPIVGDMQDRNPANMFVSSSTGFSAPAPFREVSACFPPDRDSGDGNDCVALDSAAHRSEEVPKHIVQRGKAHFVVPLQCDDDADGPGEVPEYHITDIARLTVNKGFWDEMEADIAGGSSGTMRISKTYTADDGTEILREDTGRLFKISGTRETMFSMHRNDVREKVHYNNAPPASNKGVGPSSPHKIGGASAVDDDAAAAERDETISAGPTTYSAAQREAAILTQKMRLFYKHTNCYWTRLLRVVSAIKNGSTIFVRGDMIRILSYLDILDTSVVNKGAFFHTLSNTIGQSVATAKLSRLSDAIISAHSRRYRDNDSASLNCAACDFCKHKGHLLIYALKVISILGERFVKAIENEYAVHNDRFLRNMSSIEQRAERKERGAASADGHCRWIRLMRAFKHKNAGVFTKEYFALVRSSGGLATSRTVETLKRKMASIIRVNAQYAVLSEYNNRHLCSPVSAAARRKRGGGRICDMCANGSCDEMLVAATCLMHFAISRL